MGALSRSSNWFVKTTFIQIFKSIYKVDLREAARKTPGQYTNFEDFFTRELETGTRPICPDIDGVTSPVDGTVAQLGTIQDHSLVQSKGLEFSLSSLIRENTEELEGGQYITLYLAPKDYHRIHAPLALSIENTRAIPGTMFPVNASAAESVADLFARNVRLVCRFSTNGINHYGIFVGALIVSGIKTRFDCEQTPYATESSQDHENLEFQRGEELARFVLGSTVILIMPSDLGSFDQVNMGDTVRLGQRIGSLRAPIETR